MRVNIQKARSMLIQNERGVVFMRLSRYFSGSGALNLIPHVGMQFPIELSAILIDCLLKPSVHKKTISTSF
jgi:hypothetical protein